MDTYRKIPISEFLKTELYPDSFCEEEIDPIIDSCIASYDDISLCKRFVLIDSVLQEMEQFFQLFLFNMNAFAPYVLMPDDHIVYKVSGLPADKYAINALFINLISSGKTFADKLVVVLADLDRDLYKKGKDYLSSKYDNEFAYRFFYHLRNISQHCAMPISYKGNGIFFFDLVQLVELQHYDYNVKLLDELKDDIKVIHEKYQDFPDITFTNLFDRYVKTIIEIYKTFLDIISDEITDISSRFDEMIKQHPEYICNKGSYSGWISYCNDNKNNEVQLMPSKPETLKYFLQIKSDAEKRLDKYDAEHHI